jgi:nucleotide-binding universal stress UspA family protein
MKTIVLGYDESPEAGRALEKAAELASALDARVVVASVAPALQPVGRGAAGPYDPVDSPELHRELARRAATELIERGVTAEHVSGLGDPGEAIVALADERDAEMIVVGMSHHPHVSRFLGGVGEAVAHDAHCDVLLVH